MTTQSAVLLAAMHGLGLQVTKQDLWEWFVGTPVVILLIVVAAVLARVAAATAITRITRRAVDRDVADRLIEARRTSRTEDMSNLLMGNRRRQRVKAISALLKSIATATIVVIAALLVLAQLDVNIGPLLAGAGILGAALAFGAQSLIKDYLSGIALILEDQFGVGDIVDLGPPVGTVEDVTLRTTQLRDLSGVVWYVRNGEVVRVANRSKGWTVSIIDVPVAYDEDLTRVRETVEQVASDMDDDPKYDSMLLDKPEYVGVESVTGEAVFVRVIAKSAPEQQVAVARIIRERVKLAFDAAGIKVPILARTDRRTPGGPAGPGAPGAPGTPAAPGAG